MAARASSRWARNRSRSLRIVTASSSGSIEACARNRSPSTSRSRTAPSSSPSQRSSSRSWASHVGSSKRSERPEVRAEPPGRHPRLVHAFQVAAEPDGGVVSDQPDHRGRQGGADHRLDGLGPLAGLLHLGRFGRQRHEGPDVLRQGRFGALCPFGHQPLDHRVDDRFVGILGEFGFELPEARHHSSPVQDRDLVVHHLGGRPGLGIEQSRGPADRLQPHGERDRFLPQVSPEQVDRRSRRTARARLEVMLLARQRVGEGRGGELDGPALAGPVAQGASPASQPQVLRVVVAGDEPLDAPRLRRRSRRGPRTGRAGGTADRR